ncbi:triose-phosphate isomerase family protein [Bifidobacterium sp. ESL0745]|uniref:triose-phosphate isomerase family protein n=1 Tax=Bifidobacterium sp. ESL0745 TaxID=2983226 RepID=UPI0023F65B7E|nr:triose-phosphate isomerase family protein [Bifidobacterium sp. ESL0745]MDF7664646.1 triose-phosphate isomerase [Bifidobacterium sp. ESL0745]
MTVIALSLKMYFPRERTIKYCEDLAKLVSERNLSKRKLTMAFLPDFLTLPDAARLLLPEGIRVGSQDICDEDRGAYTGEVSPADVAALGGSVAEIGHIERRRLYHEDDELISKKVAAAWRNNLTPLLCVGEDKVMEPEEAAAYCIKEIHSVVGKEQGYPLWIAYEPRWAIGAEHPAPTSYVKTVCEYLKQAISGYRDANVLYGGSAGPGLLTEIWPSVDGLFLGRFAHDPKAFISVVEEAVNLVD